MMRAARPAAVRRAAACALLAAAGLLMQSPRARAQILALPDGRAHANDEAGSLRDPRKPGSPPRPDGLTEYHNNNVNTVYNGPPPNPTRWTVRERVLVVYVSTYHWNDRRGATPGKISLKHEDGTVCGPWQARGSEGMGGLKDAVWYVEPGVIIKRGRYTVVDSDPSSWSRNRGSGECGFATIRVRPLGASAAAPIPLLAGLVALWSGDGDARDSVGGNNGRPVGAVAYEEGKAGKAFKLDGKGACADFGNAQALQLTGSMTLSVWIRPDNIGPRQNIIHKAYGGEMDITMHNDGQLEYRFGSSGQDGGGYGLLFTGGVSGRRQAGVDPGPIHAAAPADLAMMKPGRWAHVAIVRDVQADGTVALTWYVNGLRTAHTTIRGLRIKASNLPLMLGKGHQENFAGLIDEVAIWNRALSDVEIGILRSSPGVCRILLRSGRGAPGAAPWVMRLKDADRVLDARGKAVLGTLTNRSFTVGTSFGRIEIPARDLAGIVPAGGNSDRFWLLLADGQAVRGELAAAPLTLRLADGSTVDIPLREVRECGLGDDGAASAPARVAAAAGRNEMMLTLRSGEQLACTALGESLTIETPYGRAAVPGGRLIAFERPWDRPGNYQVTLASGSTLSGTIASHSLPLKLKLGPTASVKVEDIAGLTGAAPPGGDVEGRKCAAVAMSSGDRLIGELANRTLTVRTAFGNVSFPPDSAARIMVAVKGGRVQATVRLWDGSQISGELADKELSFLGAADGLSLTLPAGKVASITRSLVLPPPKIARKVEALIAQLGADSYEARKSATESLIKLGPGIASMLAAHLDFKDLEVRIRLEMILEKLGKPAS